MDKNEYILASECENLFENMDNIEKNLSELGNASTIDKQANYLQSYETSREIEEAVKSLANDDEKMNPPANTTVQIDSSPAEITNSLDIESKQGEGNSISSGDIPKTSEELSKCKRVSVVRLQAVHPPTSQQETANTELALVPVSQSTFADSALVPVSQSTSADSALVPVSHSASANAFDQSVTQLPLVSTNYSWKETDNSPSSETKIITLDFQYLSPAEETQESCISTSSSSYVEFSRPREMDRFLTVDGRYLYGYKNSKGEVQLLCPVSDVRENHNEKERKRRSRVSTACSSLRNLVPGLTPKTDKATVFEQTAKYLKFLREKYGTQLEQMYREKYIQRRK